MDNRIKRVIFNEEEHTYTFDGKALHGVTGVIGKMMGKKFPDNDRVMIATMYGSDVHKEVENYYNHGTPSLSTRASMWVVKAIEDFKRGCNMNKPLKTECEVMVSDFEGTASKVDIVVHFDERSVFLFDIKTTAVFDREYCTLQLNVYKQLYEAVYDRKVIGMYVLSTKQERMFRILDDTPSRIAKVLKDNKEASIC